MSVLAIDVVYPDVPQREIPGAYRLQNLPELVGDVDSLLKAVHPSCALTLTQSRLLVLALNTLLFGEQA